MLKNSKTPPIVEKMCQKLHCLELDKGLKRVNHTRVLLRNLQQNKILQKLRLNCKSINTKQRLSTTVLELRSSEKKRSERSIHSQENLDIFREEYKMENSIECEAFRQDAWLGYFNGYDILKQNHDWLFGGNKQCIKLSLMDDMCTIEGYLRAEISCFMIDLFLGTEEEKQKLVLHLRESELKISKEYGLPIRTALIALLSPRLQYMGIMDASKPIEHLAKEDYITITTERKYSTNCNSKKIYVNARFLLEDCIVGDFILVGPTIQLSVVEILREELKCVVVEPGLLNSHLPVRFPERCNRSQLSLEELEDITFAYEVGINVLVSHRPGSQQYLKELYETFDLLKYNDLQIFTRLVLNDYEYEAMKDIEWIAEKYEGFLVELNFQQNRNGEKSLPAEEMLELSSVCENLLGKIYNLKKPIVLDPSHIAARQLLVQPKNIPHIFQYPDKFLLSTENMNNAFFFNILHNALTSDTTSKQQCNQSACDPSKMDDDTQTLACAATSFEPQNQAIVVCSACPDMAITLSHIRPKVPIIFVSTSESLGDFITLYHQIVFIHFPARRDCSYSENVTNAFLFSLVYLNKRKILCDDQSVLLIYGSNSVTQLCDKYLLFKYKEKDFAKDLDDLLFA